MQKAETRNNDKKEKDTEKVQAVEAPKADAGKVQDLDVSDKPKENLLEQKEDSAAEVIDTSSTPVIESDRVRALKIHKNVPVDKEVELKCKMLNSINQYIKEKSKLPDIETKPEIGPTKKTNKEQKKESVTEVIQNNDTGTPH